MGFQVGHTPTHRGRVASADPIRSLEQIANIKASLLEHPRDLALFTLGVNTALRGGDLLGLRLCDLQELPDGRYQVKVVERKSGQPRRLTLNSPTSLTLSYHLLVSQPTEYVFEGRRGRLSVSYLVRLVRTWCRAAGVTGMCSSHTLRKTFVRTQIIHFRTPIPVVMRMLGHSSESQTMVYCGLMQDDIANAYENVI